MQQDNRENNSELFREEVENAIRILKNFKQNSEANMLKIDPEKEEDFKLTIGDNFTVEQFMNFWDVSMYGKYDTYHIAKQIKSNAIFANRSVVDAIRTLIYYLPNKNFVDINKEIIEYITKNMIGYFYCHNIQKFIVKQSCTKDIDILEIYINWIKEYTLINTDCGEDGVPTDWDIDEFLNYDDDTIDWNQVNEEKEQYGWNQEVGQISLTVGDWMFATNLLYDVLYDYEKYPEELYGNLELLRNEIREEFKLN